MPVRDARSVEPSLLLSGELQIDFLPIAWSLVFSESPGLRRGRSGSPDVFVRSVRLKAAKSTDDATLGIPLARFDHVVWEVRQAIERKLGLRNNPGSAPVNMQDWREKPEEVEKLLEALREDFQRRNTNRELASGEDILSVKALVSKIGCTIAELDYLQQRAIIRPKRTVGGQRRFSQRDVTRISELIDKLRRGDELPPPTGLGQVGDQLRDSPTERRRIRSATMDVVANLYADATERFPRRDHSVIEYIQSKMEWLTKDEIITLIRLARTKRDLPIYRRGRMPKSLNKGVESPAAVPIPPDEPPYDEEADRVLREFYRKELSAKTRAVINRTNQGGTTPWTTRNLSK